MGNSGSGLIGLKDKIKYAGRNRILNFPIPVRVSSQKLNKIECPPRRYALRDVCQPIIPVDGVGFRFAPAQTAAEFFVGCRQRIYEYPKA
jgi:hypothetical protein